MGNCEVSNKMCVIQQWVRTAAVAVVATCAVIYVITPQPPARDGGREGGPRGGRPHTPPAVVDAPAAK